jgi:two-component system response regulator DctR
MNTTIHLVDDDDDFRDGLSWLLDSRGHACQSWSNSEDFLSAVTSAPKPWPAAVVLLDIRMEPLSGLATFEALKHLDCPWPVLFLTGHGSVSMAVEAIKNGAWDFLEKPFQNNVLVDKVERALASAMSPDHQEAQRLRLALEQLSVREREVLDQLLMGHYNKNIADHLGITSRTVEFHRANIFSKMGVQSAIELAHLLGKHGLASSSQ